METLRFLDKSEYKKTRELAEICFGKDDFDEEYYSRDIFDNLVCVKERDGKILSMAHLSERRLFFEEGGYTDAYYILYVATLPEERHKGFMDEVMNFSFTRMREEKRELAFLVPADERIYRHLGFEHDWKFNEPERELLYADDGLYFCSAKLICAKSFKKPIKIGMKSTKLNSKSPC